MIYKISLIIILSLLYLFFFWILPIIFYFYDEIEKKVKMKKYKNIKLCKYVFFFTIRMHGIFIPVILIVLLYKSME